MLKTVYFLSVLYFGFFLLIFFLLCCNSTGENRVSVNSESLEIL